MKKLIYILPLLAFGFASAQTDPKQPETAPQKDTTTVNRQLQQQSDMKTMDAVKTQDHEKPVPKVKGKTKEKAKAKDTARTKRNTRSQ